MTSSWTARDLEFYPWDSKGHCYSICGKRRANGLCETVNRGLFDQRFPEETSHETRDAGFVDQGP